MITVSFTFSQYSRLKGAAWSIRHLHCRAAFTVIWPMQKSGHSFIFHFPEQSRAFVKEIVKEVSSVNTGPPTLTYRQQIMSIRIYFGALSIVTKFERHIEMRYAAQFGHCVPQEAPQLCHTIHTVPTTTFSAQA
jgi:hypothetical protein